MRKNRSLLIQNAKENNLKDISLSIAHDSLTVITGLSGSGKSSLAFDTIYAEGQRRYLETFSPYIRQFFDNVKKPLVESVKNVRPTLAIQQRTRILNSRSTVGSMTGLLDYLRTLWSSLAEPVCGTCGITLERWNGPRLADKLKALISNFPEDQFLIASPISIPKKKSALKAELARLNLLGFSRIFSTKVNSIIRINEDLIAKEHNGQNKEEENLSTNILNATQIELNGEILVVLDRITAKSFDLTRAREAISESFSLSKGGCSLIRLNEQNNGCLRGKNRPFMRVEQDGRNCSVIRQQFTRYDFWESARCPSGDRALSSKETIRPARPALFSFNHPLGACPNCRGFGSVLIPDIEKCVPNPNISIGQGCIVCWGGESTVDEKRALLKFCNQNNISTTEPWKNLSASDKERIITTKTKGFLGIIPWFTSLEKKIYKLHVRVFLNKYRKQETCTKCYGSRLTDDSLRYQIDGLKISQLWSKPISELLIWISELSLKIENEGELPRELREVFNSIQSRLKFLIDLGLSYLTLDRQARTLSGGETQRVNLAGALGSGLTSTHFILDEPSVGLHPRDSERLLASIKRLNQNGNTVTVVEHDPQIITSGHEIIELGPGSGTNGGTIIYQGPTNGWRGIDFTPPKFKKIVFDNPKEVISAVNVSSRNIRNLTLTIPLKKLVCITGVSGCGKSTLVQEILAKEYERYTLGVPPINHIEGFHNFNELLIVDQSPLAKSPRSNIATYSKIWDTVRTLLAETDGAKKRGLTKSSFSFNVNAGRCLQCEGSGFIKEDMQFLADVYIECESCLGKRFQPVVLEVRWQGLTVDDLLKLSIDDSASLFKDFTSVSSSISILQSLGLGHLTLGHPLSELSGGEAQRLKLVPLINSGRNQRSVVIFDEPTTGLHVRDVFKLVGVCRELVNEGHTVITIEHNISFINEADWVIDMGPDGGNEGGKLLFCGTPDDLESFKGESHTAHYLREYRKLITQSTFIQSSNAASSEILSNLNPPIIDSDKTIKIRGAREHNLQNIDLDIPIGKTIALTGVSGSGKSTIARDILFSEGQRRYLDCLSPYAQQFVQELKRPDIDALEDIPPSIYVSQHISQPNALSTLGTMTEVYNFLRLLYVKVGTQFCIDHPTQPIQGGSLNDIVGQVRAFSSQSVRILSPIIVKKKGSHKGVFEKAIASEINEVRVNGVFYKPSTLLEGLERNKVHSIDFVVAKLEASRTDDDLILSAVSLALTHGSSQAIVTDGTKDTILSLNRMCPICSRGYLKLDPEDLSFHSKRGRCPCCSGFGSLQSETLCPRCNGTRLNPVGNSVKIREKSVGELTSMGAFGVREFLENLELREHHKKVAAPIIIEIMARLNHIIGLGLGSIPLNRSSKSVSGGELQRLRLASAMGSPLSGVLYILDEPSAGLHPADNKQVLQQINQIKDGGNTVVVIEHDPTTIKACEHLIVIGPGGGKNGGSVVFEGASTDLVAQSLNSQLLSVVPLNGSQFELLDKPIPYKRDSEKNSIESISITGTKRNIKDLKLSIPLGQLVVIAGVSGAGKSTLIHDMLSETIKSGKKSNEEYILDKSSVVVPPNLERIITIDQNPIGSHCRSIPASYLKIWDEIRKLFASTIEAKTLGWTPADFSFNTGKGRCSECKGLGTITLNMSFVSTANMICEACEGKRFIDDIQRVVYNKLSINDVLSLTFGQARDLFVAHPKIHRFLSLACDLGLDYLSLGQNSSTLSGGESQRIKLVQELANKKLQRTLYLLDEPTIGLHRSDVARLISVLQSLVDRGHSVIVIEHDQDLILASDHIIELGPSAGDNGGKVIFQGTPKELYGRDTPWGRELGNG